MISNNALMDADSTSATPPQDNRLEYETSASGQIIKSEHSEEPEPLGADDLEPTRAFYIIARLSEEIMKRETLSSLPSSIYDYENPEREIITRYYAAGSDVVSPLTFFVEFSTSVSNRLWSFPVPARSDCGLPSEDQEISQELEIERDIRLWVPPKRRRPAKVRYIRKAKKKI